MEDWRMILIVIDDRTQHTKSKRVWNKSITDTIAPEANIILSMSRSPSNS